MERIEYNGQQLLYNGDKIIKQNTLDFFFRGHSNSVSWSGGSESYIDVSTVDFYVTGNEPWYPQNRIIPKVSNNFELCKHGMIVRIQGTENNNGYFRVREWVPGGIGDGYLTLDPNEMNAIQYELGSEVLLSQAFLTGYTGATAFSETYTGHNVKRDDSIGSPITGFLLNGDYSVIPKGTWNFHYKCSLTNAKAFFVVYEWREVFDNPVFNELFRTSEVGSGSGTIIHNIPEDITLSANKIVVNFHIRWNTGVGSGSGALYWDGTSDTTWIQTTLPI
jgi:hypothetical protein